MASLLKRVAAAAMLLASVTAAPSSSTLETRQTTNRVVTAHFMMGIVAPRTSSADYDADMQKAKAAGIDAFALNIGKDDHNSRQLDFAYESADRNGMKVFISFDFHYWKPAEDAAAVGQLIKTYAGRPAQMKVDGKPLVTSFVGDGVNSQVIRDNAGQAIFWVPNFNPQIGTSLSGVDGALNWIAWPNNGANKAPVPGGTSVSTSDGDRAYTNALGSKAYMASLSPWFFTHYGPEVDYSKNWVFPSDLLWYNRWNEVLALGPRLVQILTWNDYGESHYIGPLSSRHADDGNSKWTNDMPHNGWLDMAKPFIAAYKAGASSPNSYVTEDKIIYWYRPTLKGLNCDATDTTMQPIPVPNENYFQGRPDGWNTLADSVFVVTQLKTAGRVTVNSGGVVTEWDAPAGVSAKAVGMAVGKQRFTLKRNGATVLDDTSLRDISNVCPCGLYNFNAFVGTVAAGPSDPMHPDGLTGLTKGLRVTTCEAKPSLGVPTGSVPQPTANPAPQPTSSPTQACIKGTGPGNYQGLCEYACHYDYCPEPVCSCTERGTKVAEPPITNTPGKPAAGLDDSYKGLCSFVCNHGYCPPGACVYA